jgi:pyrroloquinoline quinone (PQQ) biosynthesis protein C
MMIEPSVYLHRDLSESQPDGLDALAREAQDLGRRAYVASDPAALDRAERTLYAIHNTNEFHAPIEPRAHVVWYMLAGAKLRALRDAAGAVEALTKDELRARFNALLDERCTAKHPLLVRMRSEGKTGKALRLWAKNWFASSHGFTRQLTGIALRCARDDQPALSHALAEEFEGTRHYDLRKQFLDYLELPSSTQDVLGDREYLPECLGLQSFRCIVASWNPAEYAVGAYLSIEGNWAVEAGELVRVLADAGITGKPVEVFVVHSALDEGHADEWLEIASAAHHTDEDRGRALLGAKMQLNVRWRMYDALLRAAD